jgi:hypothetical protein
MIKKLPILFSALTAMCHITFAQVTGDFRSVASGTWATVANWQSYNGTAWVAAAAAPNSGSNVITIQSPHVINIAASVTADQIVVNTGATLSTTGGLGVVLTLANGSGADLTIDGTFQESANGAISWSAGATWLMGANGRLIKTSNTSSNNWQSNYQGGIATIPATSFWIIRRNTAVNIPLSTTSPASGSVYPNLTIENNVAGTWTTPVGSSFTGSSAFPTIKGDLDIGGTGTSTVDFLNSNTHASPALVHGNMIIRTGSSARNYGTGYEIRGNLTVSGTLYYDASDTRTLTFSGSNAQTISGTGTLNIYNMTINKSSGSLTLSRAITLDNILTFTSGILYSTSVNLLTIGLNGNVTGASSASFVSGPVRYTGASAFTFPVGKGADYQALGISASAAATTFWTETFDGAACPATSGCDPSLIGWTSVSLGGEGGNANRFYVSCQENGNASGACGSGCGSDQSLHIGNVSTSSAAAFWCPSGDCGASYDASGAGEISNKRAESPVINCSGRSNITAAFNYIENGQGGSDNATFWYYDGASWTQLDDMSKVVLCSGQGTWTSRSILLPVSADNNPNVKIGFVWVNNGDGAGSDPSFAVDDITLTTSALVDFTAEYFYSDPQTTFNNTLAAGLDHISSCEYWTLTRNAGTENKEITLNWDANSCDVTNLPDMRVAHWDGTIWQNEGNTVTSGSTASGSVTSGNVTWFSPFTIASISPAGPLPIELLDFTAKYNGKDAVDLKWVTATELNNDYFTVERSADAANFNEILNKDGAGNSTHTIHYKAIDAEPLSGLTYYRLKQTDFDGKFSYSKIVPVETDKISFEVINTYNSTENGVLEVTVNCYSSDFLNLELFDMMGKKVFYTTEYSCGKQTIIRIPTGNMSHGMYMIKTMNGNTVISKKINL